MDADGNGSGMPRRPLTTCEMAAWLEPRIGRPVYAATLKRACERGGLEAYKMGGRWYVTPEAVRAYLQRNRPEGEGEKP